MICILWAHGLDSAKDALFDGHPLFCFVVRIWAHVLDSAKDALFFHRPRCVVSLSSVHVLYHVCLRDFLPKVCGILGTVSCRSSRRTVCYVHFQKHSHFSSRSERMSLTAPRMLCFFIILFFCSMNAFCDIQGLQISLTWSEDCLAELIRDYIH